MGHPTVLIVEDDELTAETLMKGLHERFPGMEVIIENDFNNALETLARVRTHEILILDLYTGGYTSEHLVGQNIWERIWKERFLPVVIYTAGTVHLDPEPPDDNPFVDVIQKGTGSEETVADWIETIVPYLHALREVNDEVHLAVQSVLKGTSPLIWQSTVDNVKDRATLLIRSTRRRLAAMMDMQTLLEQNDLKGWEQYVFPPIEKYLLTGDVLFLQAEDKDSPLAYRIVLSPSCDLVVRQDGRSKIDNVLVAKCEPMDRYLESVRSKFRIKEEDLSQRLPNYLSQPHVAGLIPLPPFRGIIPAMVANLRELDLINIDDITFQPGNDKGYERLASIDSPFREQVIWAFMSITGRPGTPPRDFDEWANEIFS